MTTKDAPSSSRKSSRPVSLNVSLQGFGSEEAAHEMAGSIGSALLEIGTVIDISNLDGVTVAHDYDDALAQLDRGYETDFVLEATRKSAVGIAMTPSVLRNEVLKSHIVLDAHYVKGILGDDPDDLNFALHTLAHECAHVEVTAAYEKCFPGELLRAVIHSRLEHWATEVVQACWDEYAVCRITGSIGYDPVGRYQEILIAVHAGIDEKIDQLVREFPGGNADPFVGAVFGAYGELLKFAGYWLGAMAAAGKALDETTVPPSIQGHWFRPHLLELNASLDDIFRQFGEWSDKSAFVPVARTLVDIITQQVMVMSGKPDGSYSIGIHHAAAGGN